VGWGQSKCVYVCEFRLLLQCRGDLLSSGVLCSNLSIPSSRVKKSFRMGLIGCPKMSVRNFHFMLRSIPEEYRSYMCVCLCVWWGAHYHVHNSLSFIAILRQVNPVFKPFYSRLFLQICVSHYFQV
jgi:hypothetical protein